MAVAARWRALRTPAAHRSGFTKRRSRSESLPRRDRRHPRRCRAGPERQCCGDRPARRVTTARPSQTRTPRSAPGSRDHASPRQEPTERVAVAAEPPSPHHALSGELHRPRAARRPEVNVTGCPKTGAGRSRSVPIRIARPRPATRLMRPGRSHARIRCFNGGDPVRASP
jgi:hypothetical protein